MTPTLRLSTRPPSRGLSPSGTPERSHPLLTHANLKTLLSIESGSIKSLNDARKWLKSRSWILAADPYDHTKLVNILATAALTSKPAELKNAAIAVAFLLDADITDHVSSTLSDAVATKALGCFAGLAEKLNTVTNFLVANDTSRVESTLALKTTTETLEGVTTTLNTLATRLTSTPPVSDTQAPTWASIVKSQLNPTA
ncbi:hypothetical protein C0992_008044 [Termitomyces sp. T32_za158]|nr:hypothetical protein C0992_008044 [Termitomyces sp. T32_za158]